ncbi:MAG: hypothetical protein HY558_07195 [Euryarchaeota archaeon]|nr:hypothetical protein [Euryarchaeota archaeon]
MEEKRPPSPEPAGAEMSLEESLQRLAEVESEIETVTRFESALGKVDTLEKGLKGVQETLQSSYLKREDVEQRLHMMETGLRNEVEKRLGVVDEAAREQVQRLSQIDGEIIQKMRKMERFFERMRDHEMELRKVRETVTTLVTQEQFAEARLHLEERLDKAKFPSEEMKELWQEVKHLRALLETVAKKSDLVDLRREMRTEELADIQKDVEKRFGGLGKSQEDYVKGLSQIDSEIIGKVRRLEQLLERVNEQVLTLRKLEAEEKGRGRERPETRQRPDASPT